ncbi:spore protease YyaC [Paenibacillus ehimensis]|uniref:spore protease YyaC n=1 Tax=Paenibacillus ehimensis TaxID=79264 RepID=UPI00047103FC|nr:spore protease YyaC [Paenibacillus ehimensis]
MRVAGDNLVHAIIKTIPVLLPSDKLVFVCIGTDRSTGDSLGPFVGTMLKEAGYCVIGTIDEPVHAENLTDRLNEIPPDKVIVAVDACLGKKSSIGSFQINKGPVKPGAGVGKILPPVGHYHIMGVVNAGGFMEYFVLQNTRLSLVISMAKQIASAIQTALPLNGIKEVAAAGE